MSGDFFDILEANGFIVERKPFVGELDDYSCYNKEIDSFSSELINYLEYPYRVEIERLLRTYYGEEAIGLFIEKLKEEDKVILKKIFFL